MPQPTTQLRHVCLLAMFGALLLALAACGGSKPAPVDPPLGERKPRVVTTTTMITDMVARVGGPDIELSGLMGAGVDPHLYKATAANVATLRQADLIFYNGLHLEGQLGEVLERMRADGKSVHALAESLPRGQARSFDPNEPGADPHVWGNAELWAACIPVVVEALSKADPKNTNRYVARGEDLKAEYLALHEWAKQQVETLPQERRLLITSHDAFNYFGEAYGFEVLGVQGLSTATEAGLADIARLADLIRERKVKAIFVESSVSPATIERLSQDSGAKIGGELFSDALGTPGEKVTVNGETYDLGTYQGFIKHNINTAVGALK